MAPIAHFLYDVWIFGMVEREAPGFTRLFITQVPDRSTTTLLPLICCHVAPGTTIVSDEWKSYKALDSLTNYTHITVNHSVQFVNPSNGACTNKIESLWSHLRRFLPHSGLSTNNVRQLLSHFLLHCQGSISLLSFIRGMTLFQPKKQHPQHENALIKKEDPLIKQEDLAANEGNQNHSEESAASCTSNSEMEMEDQESDSDLPVLADCFDSSSDSQETHKTPQVMEQALAVQLQSGNADNHYKRAI